MWNGVVTNVGLNLLEQWASGGDVLTIEKATAGSGLVAQTNLRSSTYVQGEVGNAAIVASTPVTGGTQYRVQIQPAQNASYVLHQVGIWAHLGNNGASTLIALYQEEDGIIVPLQADQPGFLFTMYAIVTMSNTGEMTVNFDTSAYMTRSDFDAAMENYVTVTTFNAANNAQNTQIANLKSNAGIVEDGNTATHTISKGQYVIWKGVLYTADAAIASGTRLAASGGNKNLTAVPNGGLNALNGNIAAVNDRLTISSITQNYKHIAADTWENTGLSITIPPEKIYIVSAYVGWSAGRPTGIGFSMDASSNTPSAALMTDGGNSSVQFSATYMLNSGTYYVCEKRNTANATNGIAIHYMVLN